MILLVDDDQEILTLVKDFLEEEGMTVRCANSGEEAIGILSGNRFRLMITDIKMPGLDGLAFSERATLLAPHMPIIMMSGEVTPEITRLAGESGIATVLSKPFKLQELSNVLNEVMA
jgi:DNA-binding response OmpR family regulator